MAALTADVSIQYKANPVKFSVAADVATTYFAGSLIFGLVAGNATKVPVTSLPFIGISAYQQVVAAGGEVECFVGPFIALLPPIATIAIADEQDFLIMDASGTLSDNPGDLVGAAYSGADIVLDNGDILVAKILRVVTAGIWISVHDPSAGLGFVNTVAATVPMMR